MSFSHLNIGQLLHELDNVDTKHKIRFYGKIKKHILLTNYGIYFNQLCLNELLYQIFTNIKLPDPEAHDEIFSLKYRRDLIKFQLNKHKNTLTEIEPQLPNIISILI